MWSGLAFVRMVIIGVIVIRGVLIVRQPLTTIKSRMVVKKLLYFIWVQSKVHDSIKFRASGMDCEPGGLAQLKM